MDPPSIEPAKADEPSDVIEVVTAGAQEIASQECLEKLKSITVSWLFDHQRIKMLEKSHMKFLYNGEYNVSADPIIQTVQKRQAELDLRIAALYKQHGGWDHPQYYLDLLPIMDEWTTLQGMLNDLFELDRKLKWA